MGRADGAVADVEQMLGRGVAFESVEAYIDGRRDLRVATRSALWLLAWAETSPEERRQETRTTVRLAELGVLELPPRKVRGMVPARRR